MTDKDKAGWPDGERWGDPPDMQELVYRILRGLNTGDIDLKHNERPLTNKEVHEVLAGEIVGAFEAARFTGGAIPLRPRAS